MHRRAHLLLLFSLLTASVSEAQTCCSGGVPLSANIGLPASEKGTWQFSASYDRNVLRTLKTGRETLDDQLRERLTTSFLLEIGYGFNAKWSVDAFFSVVEQQRNIFTLIGVNQTITRGIGDIVLLAKYNLLSENEFSNWLIGAGPKLPTGQSDKRGLGGISLPADLQPGSGALDMVLWSNYVRSFRNHPNTSVFATASYRLTGKNNDYLGSIVYQFGNELQLISGISRRFSIASLLLDPSIALRYRKAGRDSNNGVEIAATGGEWLFFAPRISLLTNPNWSVNAAFEVPLISFVNNTQLTPTHRLTIGIFYKISKKKILL